MSRTLPRLYVDAPLMANIAIPLNTDQTHYICKVMRLELGDEMRVFNGKDGEWIATLAGDRKQGGLAKAERQTHKQVDSPDLWLLFAPIKSARIDMIAEKASELGARLLWPIMTQRTQAARVNTDRLLANAIEAAEQCERLDVPKMCEPARLETALDEWPAERRLLVCAERAEAQELAAALHSLPAGPMALLVGPEGGFTDDELARMARYPFVTFVKLGPRILRAETASFAALSIWQAVKGDWQQG